MKEEIKEDFLCSLSGEKELSLVMSEEKEHSEERRNYHRKRAKLVDEILELDFDEFTLKDFLSEVKKLEKEIDSDPIKPLRLGLFEKRKRIIE